MTPMTPRNARADVERVAHVLAGVRYPAAKWQLTIHAEDYGADATTRAELWGLPAGTYESLREVLTALGRVPAPPAGGYRTAPRAQAAALDHG